jgi:hypothetical protein
MRRHPEQCDFSHADGCGERQIRSGRAFARDPNQRQERILPLWGLLWGFLAVSLISTFAAVSRVRAQALQDSQ